MSQAIYDNRKLLLNHASKYDLVKFYAKDFKSKYLKAWNTQAMFADVAVYYLNMFQAIESSLELKVFEKSPSVSYYKRDVGKHKKGNIKEVTYHRHWTSLTKLIKALVFCDESNLCLNDSLRECYDFYCKKFTSARIWRLVDEIRSNILDHKIHKIAFKTGTWKCTHSHATGQVDSDVIIDETNSKYKYWMKLDLRKDYCGDIYIPIQINEKYHDLSKSRKATWLVKNLGDKKINIIGTKEAEQLSFHDEVEVDGLDLNVKHNFCSISNGKEFDYSRTYIKEFCKQLKKLDKIGLKNITQVQRKHLEKACKRNEWYFKKLISEVLDYCEEKKIYDLVLEDLELFNGGYAKDLEFGVKYSRLVRLLRLNSVKTWMKQQAEKRGIRVHLTPAAYSSQQCPVCGCIDEENRKTQEEFCCCSCGHHDNADHNAAVNLKRRFTNVLWRDALHDVDAYGRLVPKLFKKRSFVKDILNSHEQPGLYCDVSQEISVPLL